MKQAAFLSLFLFISGCDGCSNTELIPVGDAPFDSDLGSETVDGELGNDPVDGEVIDLPEFDFFGVPEFPERPEFVNEEIYFIRTDESASPLIEPVRLTQSPEPSGFPSAVWDGSAYAVTWRDSDGINKDTYFTRFTGCP